MLNLKYKSHSFNISIFKYEGQNHDISLHLFNISILKYERQHCGMSPKLYSESVIVFVEQYKWQSMNVTYNNINRII